MAELDPVTFRVALESSQVGFFDLAECSGTMVLDSRSLAFHNLVDHAELPGVKRLAELLATLAPGDTAQVSKAITYSFASGTACLCTYSVCNDPSNPTWARTVQLRAVVRDVKPRSQAVCACAPDAAFCRRLTGSFRDDSFQQLMDRALRCVALAEPGVDVLSAIVRHLTNSLEIDFAFVARVSLNEREPLQSCAQTMAMSQRGVLVPNFSYVLHGTPCNDVIHVRSACFFLSDVASKFKEDAMLSDMGIECYIGMPLWGSNGSPIGLLAMLHRSTPLLPVEAISAVMHICAVRASGELERLVLEEQAIKYKEGLEDLVAERTSELQGMRLAAEGASQAKTSFLAAMAHEIRTPLHGILGLADLLEGASLTDEHRTFLKHLQQSGKSLLHIVNDVLDLTKIEAGRLELEEAPFHVTRFFDEVFGPLRVSAQAKSLSMSLSFGSGLASSLVGDAMRLKQLLVNLIGNAVKFTHAGGMVEVEVHSVASSRSLTRHIVPGSSLQQSLAAARDALLLGAQADGGCSVLLHVLVRDSGVGFDMARLGDLFQPFVQADTSTARNFGGTGLGLSICSRLVALMNGRLLADSLPGVGSEFHVLLRLPVALVEADALGLVACAPSHGDVNQRAFKLERGMESAPEDAVRRVLVVDDSPINCAAVQAVLLARGHTVTCCHDAEAARGAVRSRLAEAATGPLVVLLSSHVAGAADLAAWLAGERASARLVRVTVPGASEVATSAVAEPHEPRVCLTGLCRPVTLDQLYAAIEGTTSPRSLPASLPGSPRGPAAPCGGASKRVLLVEDNLVNRLLASTIMRRGGYDVTIVEDGLEALAALEDNTDRPFDVLLTDLEMPHCSGQELALRLRARERRLGLARLRVVVITASVLASHTDWCSAHDVDAILTKPFKAAELLSVLTSVLEH